MIFLWIALAICYITAAVAMGVGLAALTIAHEALAERPRAEDRSWYPRLYHGNTEAADEALEN